MIWTDRLASCAAVTVTVRDDVEAAALRVVAPDMTAMVADASHVAFGSVIVAEIAVAPAGTDAPKPPAVSVPPPSTDADDESGAPVALLALLPLPDSDAVLA